MKFGTAGIPNSCKGNILSALPCIKGLELDALELEFVHGVWLGRELARKVKLRAKSLGVLLTAHAPYYINLLNPGKAEASRKRIVNSALIASEAGAWSLVFHAGYYGKLGRKEAFEAVKEQLRLVLEELESLSIKIWIRPETTGKQSQFGTLDEIIELSKNFDRVLPCIDFAHLLARSFGKLNGYEAFSGVLEKLEDELGKEVLKNMHIHVSGIVYGASGEKYHVNLQESELKWKELLKVLKDFGADGVIICESPSLEEDAKLMKNFWSEI